MTVQPLDVVAGEEIDLDEQFDLDIRIAVGAEVTLPEAGYSCSWYSCNATCVCTIEQSCIPKTGAAC
ncbi:MAG TPA: FDLD family class I lanthipeptide [Nonomuraea sp.]|nr:FDLD family class I lanthipeptide [Nonomuraea sp.]